MTCGCASLVDIGVIDMGDTADTFDHFEQIAERGEPYWWLTAARCLVCHTEWLVAQEERQNDILVVRRLTASELSRIVGDNVWPADFDLYETLLRIGRAAGYAVRWADPINDSSLEWTIADLARQRPGISVGELAELLGLDEETTSTIAERTVVGHGLSIRSGKEP